MMEAQPSNAPAPTTRAENPSSTMNTTTTTSGGHSGYDGGEEKHSDNHHDHHDDDDNEDVEPAQEWDEGGPSHCGYHSTVHDTLMTVGATVHSVVGDPPEVVDSGMKQVGNWFQEASYAIRDFLRGDKDVGDDAADALSSMHKDVAGLMGSPNEEKKTDDGYTPANTTQSTVNHSSADPSGTN